MPKQEEHFSWSNYISKKRWISYWHQIEEVSRLTPNSLLEIGVGAGVFKQIASQFCPKVITVDINPELNPDEIASVLDLPFKDCAFDVVVAFQVLEHLPYDYFSKAISEMKRVSAGHIIISLPDADTVWRFVMHIPRIGEKDFFIKRPKLRPVKHSFDGEHYWEISKKGYPLSRIIKEFDEQRLNLIKTYRVPETTYHRFFLLSKHREDFSV